jgi:hypothetical protein
MASGDMKMKEEVCGRRVCAVLAATLAVGLGACAKSQVSPVASLDIKQICVIENPKVRTSFLDSYRKALEERGYTVRVLPDTARLSSCPVTSTYVAYWWWDIVLYMRHAELEIYKDEKLAGRAVFEAGQSRLFTDDGKIRELVTQLLP